MGTYSNNTSQPTSRFGPNEMKLIRTMFDDAPVAAGILEGPDHHIQYFNQNLHKLFGNRPYSRGTPMLEFWTEQERQQGGALKRLDIMNQVYSSGKPYFANEHKLAVDRSFNGNLQEGYFTFVYQPLVDQQVYGIFITGYEVTDLVRARQKSIWNERRLEFALEGADVGFWEFDIESKTVKYVSDQGKAHFGLSPEESFKNKKPIEFVHPEDRSDIEESVRETFENLSPYNVEYRVLWPDGSLHWLQAQGQALRDDQGQPRSLVGITVDITRQKQAEQKLQEAIRLRDEFISIATHELQTPMASLKIRGELFERQLRSTGQDTQAQLLATINRQIDQLSSLMTKLLDMSRMQRRGLALEKEPFQLDELIHEKIDTLRHVTHHHLDVEGPEDIVICADRFRIDQVLTNLIENAIKYSPQADRVLVRYIDKDDEVVISIVDYGIGIPPQEREMIFERFYKGSEGSKETYPGFGIGLYIASQIVLRHGGRIWVEDNPDGGSIFSFSLPIGEVSSSSPQ